MKIQPVGNSLMGVELASLFMPALQMKKKTDGSVIHYVEKDILVLVQYAGKIVLQISETMVPIVLSLPHMVAVQDLQRSVTTARSMVCCGIQSAVTAIITSVVVYALQTASTV